ncbi:MAG: head decoration protein [Pseudomonas sp.]
MTVKYETLHAGEFLLSEGAGKISREAIMVIAGPALVAGQVLGLVTATHEFAPYDPAAIDGTEVATCILYGPLGESTEERRASAVVRLAEVSTVHLTGLDAAAEEALAAHFVIAR